MQSKFSRLAIRISIPFLTAGTAAWKISFSPAGITLPVEPAQFSDPHNVPQPVRSMDYGVAGTISGRMWGVS